MSCPNVMLVVNDDRAWLAEVAACAKCSDFEMLVADSAESFERGLSEAQPSLILLDLHTADMDGIEGLRHLAAIGSTAEIVLLSDMDSRVLTTACQFGLSLGLNVLAGKQRPVSMDDLETILRQHGLTHAPISAAALKQAIEEYELVLHYQPILRRSTRGWVVADVEALLRWQHPQRGLLLPGQFLFLADQGGLMMALTDFVLTESLRQVGHWRARGMEVGLTVNLSPSMITDLNFPDRLTRVLREHGVPPEQLTFEVTELAAVGDPDTVLDSFARLRLRGVGLALDDFGVGTSSLTQLYKMPYDSIKIDQALIGEATATKQARIIVEAMIDLGHKLSLGVCAEGVETAASFDLLDQAGCDQLQGDYISKPLPPVELESFLLAWGDAA